MLDDDVEEIKVGDYIRTNIGTFDKIIQQKTKRIYIKRK